MEGCSEGGEEMNPWLTGGVGVMINCLCLSVKAVGGMLAPVPASRCEAEYKSDLSLRKAKGRSARWFADDDPVPNHVR
jgi:peptide subunit release factor RF-3